MLEIHPAKAQRKAAFSLDRLSNLREFTLVNAVSRRIKVLRLAILALCAAAAFAGGGLNAVESGGGEEFSPTETAVLRERSGQETVVVGDVSRVGVGPTGVVHFINFRGVPRDGFTVVVKKGNIPAFTEKFGSDFPFNLTGKRLRVSGPVYIFKNEPQIELLSPEQLSIID